MADKDKTPAKKKTYKKPTADRLDDSDLRDVTGGEDVGCSSPGGPSTKCKMGGAAIEVCDTGGAAQRRCNPGGSEHPGPYRCMEGMLDTKPGCVNGSRY